ncbi:MAG: hypothetical protein JWR53_1564 [Glaciihabitans sp.]|jgi:hypothetical protein|nr:hypothetical protein [Glaciihabitans sp.]
MTIKPRTKRVTAAILILAAIVFAVWAVATRAWETTPSFADVAGVWQRGDSDMRMTIYPSGDVTFANVPKGVLEWQGDKHDNTTRPESAHGQLDPFWNYGSWGGISSGYSLANGEDGKLYSEGNGVTGYHLSLSGGDDLQYRYDFHRISGTP